MRRSPGQAAAGTCDREGEQALAACQQQRAELEHPGGEFGRDGAVTPAGRGHVPAVHGDLDGAGARDDARRDRQAAHDDELRGRRAVARPQEFGGAVPDLLDGIAGWRRDRLGRAEAAGAEGFLQVGHGFPQVAEQRAQIPLRARRGQRQLPRRDDRAGTEGITDRAREERRRTGPHAGIDRRDRRILTGDLSGQAWRVRISPAGPPPLAWQASGLPTDPHQAWQVRGRPPL